MCDRCAPGPIYETGCGSPVVTQRGAPGVLGVWGSSPRWRGWMTEIDWASYAAREERRIRAVERTIGAPRARPVLLPVTVETVGSLSEEDRRRVYDERGGRCHFCERRVGFDAAVWDRIKLGRRFYWVVENLAPAHEKCWLRGSGTRLTEEAGLRCGVPGGEPGGAPAEVPGVVSGE
jgi:hypothetical protein